MICGVFLVGVAVSLRCLLGVLGGLVGVCDWMVSCALAWICLKEIVMIGVSLPPGRGCSWNSTLLIMLSALSPPLRCFRSSASGKRWCPCVANAASNDVNFSAFVTLYTGEGRSLRTNVEPGGRGGTLRAVGRKARVVMLPSAVIFAQSGCSFSGSGVSL